MLATRLEEALVGYDVQTVPEAGWAGEKNGALLKLAAGSFDAFVTVDKNLPYQQSLVALSFAVVALVARSNRLADLLPLVPALLEALDSASPGQVVKIGA